MEQGKEIEVRILSTFRRRSNYHKYKGTIQESFFQLEPTKQVFTIINECFDNPKIKDKKIALSHIKLIIHRTIRNEELRDECLNICKELRKYKTKDNPVIEDTIKDFAKRQLIRKGVLAALEELDRGNPDFTKVQEQIDKAIMVGADLGTNFYSYFEDPENRIIEEREQKRIMTIIPKLDKAIDGGFIAGELVVILAPPERGKTITMVNLAVAALMRGLTVGFLTLELSERQVARRFDLRISGRPISVLRADPGRIKNPLAALRRTGCDLVIKDYSADNPRIEDIKSFIETYQDRMKKKFDILFVDYADLIMPTKSFKQERFGLKEVYTNLRRLANELKIPIVTASQANRKSLDKLVVTMADFDECFAKAGIADIIIGLCQTQEELEDELCRAFIAKNRNSGRHKIIRLTMRPKTMYIGEYNQEEDLEYNKGKRKETVADKI